MESIIDAIEHSEWAIKGWKIKFLLSDRQLQQTKKTAGISNWYESIVVKDTWVERLNICFNTIQLFHQTFNLLPQVGDRLFDDATGLMVQDRSIDGDTKTVTFVLTD